MLPAEQQQAAERERVGRDDPLARAVGEAQRVLRGGQRDVHDGGVEHDHQLRDAEDREDRPPPGMGGVEWSGGGHRSDPFGGERRSKWRTSLQVEMFPQLLIGAVARKTEESSPLSARLRFVTTDASPQIDDERPLRRDAARNRERILEAAGEVFATRGLEVTLDDIAHHAGVGVGTVYRRFRDKEQLIDALFDDRIGRRRWPSPRQALAVDDPWLGLEGFFVSIFELQAADRGLRELAFAGQHGRERVARAQARLEPLIAEARRARAGLRASCATTSAPMTSRCSRRCSPRSSTSPATSSPDLWRRYLDDRARRAAHAARRPDAAARAGARARPARGLHAGLAAGSRQPASGRVAALAGWLCSVTPRCWRQRSWPRAQASSACSRPSHSPTVTCLPASRSL